MSQSEHFPAAAQYRHGGPLEALGKLLYEELELSAPSSPSPFVEWGELTELQRSLYVNCVERLLEQGELVERARQLSDDDVVSRRPDK